MMWFVWGLVVEGAHVAGLDCDRTLGALLLAGIDTGSAADFAWRGHRRTRAEYYAADAAVERLLVERGLYLANDIDDAIAELHLLYRVREGRSPEQSRFPASS
jgi:hypothetical protein